MDYKEMYLKMMRASEQAIRILVDAPSLPFGAELIFVQTRQQNSGNTLCITGIICEAWTGKSRTKPA